MAQLLPAHIIRRCILRIGGYRGQPTAIEASYVKADPTDDSVSASFVPSSWNDELTTVEEEIAGAVAMNLKHPWRGLISDVTASIASGGEIPAVGASGATAKIIGEYGQVRDAVSPFRPLSTDLSISEIRALSQNPGTVFKSDIFSYQREGRRLDHTRTNAIVDVCVFDYDARLTAIAANGALLFQSAANAYFTGVMSLLKNTDPLLTELANQYGPRFQAWLVAIGAGQSDLSRAA